MHACMHVFIFWNDEIYGRKTTEVHQWIPKRVNEHQEVSKDDDEDDEEYSEDDDEDSEDDD